MKHIREWEVAVLQKLVELQDGGFFKIDSYTIPELCNVLKIVDAKVGYESLRTFLYELRDVNALEVEGHKEKNGKEHPTYVPNQRIIRGIFVWVFEETHFFQFAAQHVYDITRPFTVKPIEWRRSGN